jgi:hypothetical protein
MTVPAFPWLFVDESGDEHRLQDLTDAQTFVEYVDDEDPPYRCLDANGTRLRLIMWALELVLRKEVPADFDPAGLRVAETPAGWYEEYAGVVHRVLTRDGKAEPAAWDQDILQPTPAAAVPSDLGAAEFHRRWMQARLGKRFAQ